MPATWDTDVLWYQNEPGCLDIGLKTSPKRLWENMYWKQFCWIWNLQYYNALPLLWWWMGLVDLANFRISLSLDQRILQEIHLKPENTLYWGGEAVECPTSMSHADLFYLVPFASPILCLFSKFMAQMQILYEIEGNFLCDDIIISVPIQPYSYRVCKRNIQQQNVSN